MTLFGAPVNPVSAELSDYNNAVNASRFVKGFGIAALANSILAFLGINLLSAGLGLGTGLFIFRYDTGMFYRVLGAVVMALALVAPLPFLSPGVLAASVLFKGVQVLRVLNRSPREDPDWSETRSRTMLGLVASGASLLLCAILAVLSVIALIFIIARGAR